MALPVRLEDVIDAIEQLNDESKAYINRLTGEIVVVTGEDARLVEEEACESELPAWQAELLPKIREALQSDDFVCLPDRYEIHEWGLMERFSLDQPEMHREILLDAIHGAGAFRMFKNTVRRLDIDNAWYRFRDAAVERIARDWLEAEQIPYESSERPDRST